MTDNPANTSPRSHPARAEGLLLGRGQSQAGPWCDSCSEYTLDPQWPEGEVDLINGKWMCNECVYKLDIRADVPEPPF